MDNEKTAERALYKSEVIVKHLVALETAIEKFEALAGRIGGFGSECEEKGGDLNSRSLADLLDLIPEILDGYTSTIHKTTNSLEEALY